MPRLGTRKTVTLDACSTFALGSSSAPTVAALSPKNNPARVASLVTNLPPISLAERAGWPGSTQNLKSLLLLAPVQRAAVRARKFLAREWADIRCSGLFCFVSWLVRIRVHQATGYRQGQRHQRGPNRLTHRYLPKKLSLCSEHRSRSPRIPLYS